MMNKVILALFLIGFWLFLPIPFMLLNVDGYEELDITEAEDTEEIGFLNFLGTMGNLFGIYWKLFFMSFPTVSSYINYFLLFLKVATITLAIFMIRGN